MKKELLYNSTNMRIIIIMEDIVKETVLFLFLLEVSLEKEKLKLG